ncbi:MAG TPA: hypothetical protein PLT89_05840, partial [Syntrophomonadaceae bacterium]|nr:hypothetical protein [Syntrophomonadaceae bacterium]
GRKRQRSQLSHEKGIDQTKQRVNDHPGSSRQRKPKEQFGHTILQHINRSYDNPPSFRLMKTRAQIVFIVRKRIKAEPGLGLGSLIRILLLGRVSIMEY